VQASVAPGQENSGPAGKEKALPSFKLILAGLEGLNSSGIFTLSKTFNILDAYLLDTFFFVSGRPTPQIGFRW